MPTFSQKTYWVLTGIGVILLLIALKVLSSMYYGADASSSLVDTVLWVSVIIFATSVIIFFVRRSRRARATTAPAAVATPATGAAAATGTTGTAATTTAPVVVKKPWYASWPTMAFLAFIFCPIPILFASVFLVSLGIVDSSHYNKKKGTVPANVELESAGIVLATYEAWKQIPTVDPKNTQIFTDGDKEYELLLEIMEGGKLIEKKYHYSPAHSEAERKKRQTEMVGYPERIWVRASKENEQVPVKWASIKKG